MTRDVRLFSAGAYLVLALTALLEAFGKEGWIDLNDWSAAANYVWAAGFGLAFALFLPKGLK